MIGRDVAVSCRVAWWLRPVASAYRVIAAGLCRAGVIKASTAIAGTQWLIRRGTFQRGAAE